MSTETNAPYNSTDYGFKLPVQNVGFVSGTGTLAGSGLGAMATNAITKVIGPISDAKRFIKSLATQFQFVERDGLRVARFAPSGVPGRVNPSSLSGSAAVFFNSASGRLQQSREVLKKLEPLCHHENEDCCGDIRAVIQAKLDDLETALGADCGPCDEWVEAVFEQLLGNGKEIHGLVDQMEDDFGIDATPMCPDEETKKASIRLFRHALRSLRGEWNEFGEDFKNSVSMKTHRMERRIAVAEAARTALQSGLTQCGFGDDALSVETLGDIEDFDSEGDEDESSTEAAVNERAEPVDNVPVKGTVGCAIKRIESFSAYRAPSLLRQSGTGALRSLQIESGQLENLACAIRRWVHRKIGGQGPQDSCMTGGASVGVPDMIKQAEHLPRMSLVLSGVATAAYVLWCQLKAIHCEARSLLKSPRKVRATVPSVPSAESKDEFAASAGGSHCQTGQTAQQQTKPPQAAN